MGKSCRKKARRSGLEAHSPSGARGPPHDLQDPGTHASPKSNGAQPNPPQTRPATSGSQEAPAVIPRSPTAQRGAQPTRRHRRQAHGRNRTGGRATPQQRNQGPYLGNPNGRTRQGNGAKAAETPGTKPEQGRRDRNPQLWARGQAAKAKSMARHRAVPGRHAQDPSGISATRNQAARPPSARRTASRRRKRTAPSQLPGQRDR